MGVFFPGKGKIFRWGAGAGGQKHTIFFQKSRKTYYFVRLREGKCPLMPSPADAHERGL